MEAFRLDCDYIDFTPRSLELSPVNFFYGKNGTGKSTLVDLLKKQYEGLYTIQIFRGYDKYVSENRELNAITLGQTNVEVQQKIDQLNTEITRLEKELDSSSETSNCETRLLQAETYFNETKTELDKLYSKCASIIKNITNPSITPTTAYNKNNFCCDIEFAKELPQSEIDKLKKECLTNKLPNPKRINYPIIDLASITQKVNDLLAKTIIPTIQLPEIGDNPEKQAFAKEGMRIHNRNTDNKCAFCGGYLTSERWDELSELFNDAASVFQEEIKTTKHNVNCYKAALEQVELLNPQEYYPAFHNSILELNQQIANNKAHTIQYLNKLSQQLSQREKQLFTTLETIECDQSSWTADKLQESFDYIYQQNSKYDNEIDQKHKNAQNQLRYHYVANCLKDNDYESKRDNNLLAKKAFEDFQTQKQEVEKQLHEFQAKKADLIKRTSNEQIAADYINKALRFLGNESFELQLINSSSDTQGQYAIYSQGRQRDIDTLSTGERNLVAFLYFMQKLNAYADTDKLMVIFDDPMNSNDEITQYLMYSYIQNYCTGDSKFSDANKRVFVLLTHNAHFFLNARPYTWKPTMKKISCFTLAKENNITNIQKITNPTNDIKTGYEALWHELRFAYNNNRPVSMLNILRRIIDTFADFNRADSPEALIRENTSQDIDYRIAAALKKSADVYSHGIYEPDSSADNFTREQIIEFAQWYFNTIGGIKHFHKLWDASETNPITD